MTSVALSLRPKSDAIEPTEHRCFVTLRLVTHAVELQNRHCSLMLPTMRCLGFRLGSHSVSNLSELQSTESPSNIRHILLRPRGEAEHQCAFL